MQPCLVQNRMTKIQQESNTVTHPPNHGWRRRCLGKTNKKIRQHNEEQWRSADIQPRLTAFGNREWVSYNISFALLHFALCINDIYNLGYISPLGEMSSPTLCENSSKNDSCTTWDAFVNLASAPCLKCFCTNIQHVSSWVASWTIFDSIFTLMFLFSCNISAWSQFQTTLWSQFPSLCMCATASSGEKQNYDKVVAAPVLPWPARWVRRQWVSWPDARTHAHANLTLQPLIVTWVTSELVSHAGRLPTTSVPIWPASSSPWHNQAIVVDRHLEMDFHCRRQGPKHPAAEGFGD